MKMPVPIVAPMPNIDSWKSPIERASSPFSVSVPVSAVIAVTGLRRRICSSKGCLTEAMDSLSSLVDVAREQVGPGLAPDHDAGVSLAREDHRDAAVAVVVVGHRVAVGARHRDG